MSPRLIFPLLAAAALLLCAAAPAGAASVAYIDGHNLWFSSPDGGHKVQVTQGGTEDASWNWPSQGPDGKTVVEHRDTFDGGEKRPVLYLYGADGKLITANVMPVYAGATAPVYPIALDMDWKSNAVAYGYSYCGFACQSVYRGYWLTFSDNQGAYPSDPQGQSDAYNPTFYGTRVVSSDSGGNIFVQPDVAEAPFTNSYQGWLQHGQGYHLSRAEVSPTNNTVAVEWLQDGGAEGITLAQYQSGVPSDLVTACELPVAANPGNLTFSPDGTQMAWHDDEGVKVSGVPNFAAGTDTCSLTAPPHVISTTGRQPAFGGANVEGVTGAGGGAGGGQPGGGGSAGGATGGGGTTGGGKPRSLQVVFPLKATRAAFAKGLTIKVAAARAGRIDASATIPAKVARKLRLKAGASSATAAQISSRAFAAASTVVVARGHATAKRAAQTVKLRLRPTKAAKRAARRMRKVVLTIKVGQGAASGRAKVKLR
jgi:hypothetical protein